jgi:predicted enzyme related to lactoylglutathione lyase
MSERDRYEFGVPCWVDTAQPDVDAAMDFYAELFGWEFAGPGEMPGDPPGRYYVARVRGRDVAGVSSMPAGGDAPVAWTTHVSVDSVERAAERVAAAGGTVIAPPFEVPPAGRMAVVSDPAGAVFGAWEPGDRHGAQVVNEPSAWSMSRLQTPDPGGAKAFYGDVFGWQTEAFEMGDQQAELWRLPGYVGGEPEQPVARDVVAVMAASNGGAPAQWNVDFWIADADRAVATAERLGGEALMGPIDLPGFRMAALRDPQGAVFSVSQLVRGG